MQGPNIHGEQRRYPSDGGALRAMMEEVYACNLQNGWIDDGRTFGDEIALLHSELSEALEHYRTGGPGNINEVFYGKGDKPDGVPIELADVLVRLLDTCGRHNVDLFAAWRIKMSFNWQRSYRHGGKAL